MNEDFKILVKVKPGENGLNDLQDWGLGPGVLSVTTYTVDTSQVSEPSLAVWLLETIDEAIKNTVYADIERI